MNQKTLHVPYVHKAKSRHIDQGGLFFPRFQGDLTTMDPENPNAMTNILGDASFCVFFVPHVLFGMVTAIQHIATYQPLDELDFGLDDPWKWLMKRQS